MFDQFVFNQFVFDQPGSTSHAGDHVVHDSTMFMLGAEQDYFGVFDRTNAVSRWPVEEVVPNAYLFSLVCVADEDFT